MPSDRHSRRISAQSSTDNTSLPPRLDSSQGVGRGQLSAAVQGSVFTRRRHSNGKLAEGRVSLNAFHPPWDQMNVVPTARGALVDAPLERLRAAAAQQLCTTKPHALPRASPP